jgi:anaerobic selenocysteine-containing dehydrogenase
MYEEYPIILMTGARSPVFFHTEHRQIPSLRQFHTEPFVEIHPAFAKNIGAKDGDWLWIENPRGRCRQRAKLSEGIRPNCALGQHGWWFPEQDGNAPNLFGFKQSNINLLLKNAPSLYGFGADIKCSLCKIYPVREGEM